MCVRISRRRAEAGARMPSLGPERRNKEKAEDGLEVPVQRYKSYKRWKWRDKGREIPGR